jgi:hypothetical protein
MAEEDTKKKKRKEKKEKKGDEFTEVRAENKPNKPEVRKERLHNGSIMTSVSNAVHQHEQMKGE